MADIRLNITGDASGASAALEEAGKKTEKMWGVVLAGAAAAAAGVAAFAAASLRAFAESERGQRQLVRAAGEYAGAIDEQSKALSRLYAIDDDLIKQSAVLLTQWGGVGAATKDVEIAAMDLASAMGTDLNTATRDLIRNVESGGVGLAKMGIHFEATGDKGHDLAAAVAAINSKLGGSAAADAGSLIGSAHAASIAFEDLQKSFGGLVAAMVEKSGAMAAVTGIMRDMQAGADFLGKAFDRLPGFLAEAIKGKGFATQALLKEANNAVADLLHPSAASLPGVTGQTNKGLKAGGGKAADLQAHEELSAAHDAIYRHEEESAEHTFNKIEKLRFELASSSEDAAQAEAKRAAEQAAREAKDAAKVEEQALKDQNDRVAKKAKEAQAAGDAIGAAMVNALADQLAKLAEGGEFDAALFMSEILAAAVGVAGTVIGTAFGQPAVGAAIGNIAAMGIRAGGSAISKSSKSNKPRTFHDGGWIGDDERVITAQTGEFMMSRAMVQNAGGRGAVEQIAKGRGGGAGLTINLTAIDTKSVADTFSGPGADGLKQALKRGHGALPSLLQRNPR